MKRWIVLIPALALTAAAFAGSAQPATATTTWEFPGGSFTLMDVIGSSATVTVRGMQVTGSSA